MTELIAYSVALRLDFMVFYEACFALLEPGTTFHDNWYIHAIAEQLRRVEAGETTRLIINVPPRSGKSTLITVAFTAWLLGHSPRLKIICVSHSTELARAHARAFRTIVTSDWFLRAFPRFRIARGGNRSFETVTTEHGFRYAVSISGTVMGRGADIIIADDAMSPDAAFSEAVRLRQLEFWDTAHRTRLNDAQRGIIISVSQRLHEGDLVAHLLTSGSWNHLVIPAIATESARYSTGPNTIHECAVGQILDPVRLPQTALDELRASMGSMRYSAQYMQRPVPPEGNLIHREWLHYHNENMNAFEVRVASWDTASTLDETSSFSVGMLWGSRDDNYYLLDVVRERFEAPDLRREMIECNRDWRPSATLIENTELGRSLAQDFRRREGWRVLLRQPRYGKEARLIAQIARFETRRVYLQENAHWLSEYERELLAFPRSQFTDQVDATSQVLDYFSSLVPLERPIVRRNPPRRSIGRRNVERSA